MVVGRSFVDSGEAMACPEGRMISGNTVLKGIESSSSIQWFLCNNLLFYTGVRKFLIGGWWLGPLLWPLGRLLPARTAGWSVGIPTSKVLEAVPLNSDFCPITSSFIEVCLSFSLEDGSLWRGNGLPEGQDDLQGYCSQRYWKQFLCTMTSMRLLHRNHCLEELLLEPLRTGVLEMILPSGQAAPSPDTTEDLPTTIFQWET